MSRPRVMNKKKLNSSSNKERAPSPELLPSCFSKLLESQRRKVCMDGVLQTDESVRRKRRMS